MEEDSPYVSQEEASLHLRKRTTMVPRIQLREGETNELLMQNGADSALHKNNSGGESVYFNKEDESTWISTSEEAALLEMSEEDEAKVIEQQESSWAIFIQVFIPFLIAGIGTVGAGLVLDQVQHWQSFQEVTEIFILVPALLGLKGNLEMTLASRLSTQANLGRMDKAKDQWLLATGNMALIQCQALVVGLSASLFAVAMEWIPQGHFNWNHVAVLVASSVVTASLASLILGSLMVLVVIGSRKFNINPDNVATPIAASLGDLTTLVILAGLSSFFLKNVEQQPLVAPITTGLFLLSTPCWALLANRNHFTSDVLHSGWVPVIVAMIISSLGGCILNVAVSKFRGIAVFQPVINGVGGNLVAVQASRISTYFHQRAPLGVIPKEESKNCTANPFKVFFSPNSVHSRTACLLLAMSIPGHLIFAFGIRMVRAGHTSVTPIFLIVYLLAALFQVALLLYIAQIMVFFMWKTKVDPDNSAIPYLTALGDLLGTLLLAIAFMVLYNIGDKDNDVGD